MRWRLPQYDDDDDEEPDHQFCRHEHELPTDSPASSSKAATRTVVDPAGGDIASVPFLGVDTQACIVCGEFLTVSCSIDMCMAMVPTDLRIAVLVQVRPQWLQALAANPVRYKIIVSNGRIVRKRALPFDVAVPLVTVWIPAAIETIRQDVSELAASLALWDQAQQVVAGHVNIDEEVDDDDV